MPPRVLAPSVCTALAGILALTGCSGGADGSADAPADPTPTRQQREPAAPTPRPTTTEPALPPLPQPTEDWEDPKLLRPPPDGATVLQQLKYEIVNQVWVAAGVRTDTGFECDITEEELAIPGTYDFECIATYEGIDVPFAVQTSTDGSSGTSQTRTDFVPITRKKAEYELTRQAFEPAQVSCDMDEVQLVRIGDPDALDCEVTDIHDEEHFYDGEVSANGGVFFAAS